MIMYVNRVDPDTLLIAAFDLPSRAIGRIGIVADKGDHSVASPYTLAAICLPLRIPGRFDRHIRKLEGSMALFCLVDEVIPCKFIFDGEADKYLFQCG
jgi:hypothetical protein